MVSKQVQEGAVEWHTQFIYWTNLGWNRYGTQLSSVSWRAHVLLCSMKGKWKWFFVIKMTTQLIPMVQWVQNKRHWYFDPVRSHKAAGIADTIRWKLFSTVRPHHWHNFVVDIAVFEAEINCGASLSFPASMILIACKVQPKQRIYIAYMITKKWNQKPTYKTERCLEASMRKGL